MCQSGQRALTVIRSTVAAACCVAAANCSKSDGRSKLDEAGDDVRVISARQAAERWKLGNEPVLRIGSSGEGPQYEFHNIRFAGRLSDGRVVVVDGGSSQVRWYDAAGGHRNSSGRRGDGPGEFRGIANAVLTSDDRLVLLDDRNRRVTWFSPEEAVDREESLAGVTGSAVTLLHADAGEGILISESRPVVATGSSDFTYTRDSLAVLLHTPATIDTIAVVPGSEAVTWVSYSDGRPTATLQLDLPFAYEVSAGATTQALVIASPDRQQIEFFDHAAHRLRIVRHGGDREVRVTTDDRRQYVDYVTRRATEFHAPDLRLVISGAHARLALVPEDRARPSFDRLITDGDDRIWVRDYMAVWETTTRPQIWTIYSATGRPLARLTTPAGFEVEHVSHGHVTGVERDAFDVEYVAVYQFGENQAPPERAVRR